MGPPPDVDAAVRRALAERTDLVRARKEIEITRDRNRARRRTRRSRTCGCEANYLTDGAGGTRLLRTGGFPGTITGTEVTDYGDVLGQVLTFDYPTWTVGMTFSYPLGKSAAEANLARARIERDQPSARLRGARDHRVREVREAALAGLNRISSGSRRRCSRASLPSSGSTRSRSASTSGCRRASW